ncbi:MAG: ROK family protein [Deltaproteobacteria bacterium]|nr:ROK family protein [Deltaproteobacteria bacterium]
MKYYIGIDLGGTNIRAALLREDNKVIKISKEKTEPSKDPRKVALQTSRLIEDLQFNTTIKDNLAGVCIGLAGLLSPDGQTVKIGPNFGWRDVPFANLVKKNINTPLFIVNDLTAVAYGEFVIGAGRGSKNMFCVYVGSGIGSALIIDGKPYDGSSNVAGELGHIKLREGGRMCGCGSHGCLEAYTGGNSVRQRLIELAKIDKKGFLNKAVSGKLERLNFSFVEKGYKKRDALCSAIWSEIRFLLASSIANVVTIFNPDCVVLGGGAIVNTPLLLNAIMEDIRRYATSPSCSVLKIKKAALGDDAGMIGAALLIKEKLNLT